MEEEIKVTRKRRSKAEMATSIGITNINSGRTYLRDDNNLIKGINYEYDEYGFIKWRNLIKSEHIVLNKAAFAKDGDDITALTKEETEEKKLTVSEDKLLIKLAGFRDLCNLRGFISILPSISYRDSQSVICETTIEWLPNFETGFNIVKTRGTASASPASVAPTYVPFLEAIASNRAFVRAVREFLRIFTVCEEEMNMNEVVEVSSVLRPSKYLSKICKEKSISFDTLLSYLEANGLSISESMDCFEKIPDKIATTALELIKNDY